MTQGHSLRFHSVLTFLFCFTLATSVATAETQTVSTKGTDNATVQASTEKSKSSGKTITREKNLTTESGIQAQLTARFHTSPTWVHSTWLDYITDVDGDGFYHHFRFGFDADTDYTEQPIYAELYLQDGIDTVLLFESGTIWLNGDSGNDAYEISTSLNAGYPAQTYDLVLRLYDADTHELLQELTYLDDDNLANLFLEGADSDTVFYSAPYIYHFTSDITLDGDNDGYYTHLNMTVDVDAPHTTTPIQLGVEIYDPQNGWISLYLSDEWFIQGADSTDAQTISITLEQGLPEDYYEIRLTVYESASRAIVTTETISQRLPMESLDYDAEIVVTHEYSSSTSVGTTVSGGATGFIFLPILCLLSLARRKKN